MKFERQILPGESIRKGKKGEEGIKTWAWISRIKLTDKKEKPHSGIKAHKADLDLR